MQRMRELAVQSSNDTLTSTERDYTDQEFQQLIEEIDRIADVTNYNGMKLISEIAGANKNDRFGLSSDTSDDDLGSTLWIDANTEYGVDSITITIDTLSSYGVGLSTGSETSATFLTSQSDAVQAISKLDAAINSVNTMRSDMGAYVNRLEHAINNLMISNTNQQSAESLIRDVDFASESSQFTRNQILTQSGTAMLSQANMVPQNVLRLLG